MIPRRYALLLCLLIPIERGAAQFVEISATVEFLARASWQTNAEAIQNGDWSWTGTGTLKSIHQAAAPTNLFNPAMQQTIVDWRFNDEASGMNANIYPWTNATVPQTNEPALQAAFKNRIEHARRLRQSAE